MSIIQHKYAKFLLTPSDAPDTSSSAAPPVRDPITFQTLRSQSSVAQAAPSAPAPEADTPSTGIKIAYLHVGDTGDPNYYLDMELGLSDGVLADQQVVSIDPTDVGGFNAIGSAPDHITALGSNFLFEATDHTHGRELWISDGTSAGTHLLMDINTTSPTASHSAFSSYNNPAAESQLAATKNVVLGNEMYFSANDGVHGTELWKTDGTAAGTVRVTDIFSGAANSNPTWMTALGGKVYFTATDGSHPGQIWETDGTTTGQVTSIATSASADTSDNGQPDAFYLTASGGHLFFEWYDATNNSNAQELWVVDPNSASGATQLSSVAYGGPSNMTDIDGILYFSQSDGTHGQELWRSDGTVSGTYMVADINQTGSLGTNAGGSQPFDFVKMGSWIYFAADDGIHGRELWKTDGLVGGTTEMVKDIATPEQNRDPSGSAFFNTGGDITVVGNELYFGAMDGGGGHGIELWKSDGTEAGTVMVGDLAPGASDFDPTSLTNVNGTLYFEANDVANGENSIYKTDGTAAGTVVVATGTNGEFNFFTVIAPQAAAVASNDAFSVAENATAGSGHNLFADNGSGADTGSGLTITAINGNAASVGQQITLASGAHLTVNADGTFSYNPNDAFDALPGAASGASNTSATDSFTYTLTGGSTATVTMTVTGVDSNDTLLGTSGVDRLNGGSGNDTITGGGGNDIIDGGSGLNTAVYSGSVGDYSLNFSGTTAITIAVRDQRDGSPDGTDTLTNIQQIKFSDALDVPGFDDSGNLTANDLYFSDGAINLTRFNYDPTQDWSSYTLKYGTDGNFNSERILLQTDELWVNTYDPTDTDGTLWTTQHFDTNRNLVEQTTTNYNGTHTLTINDVANQYAWTDATISFDANWNVTGVTGHNDSGTGTVTMGQVEAALDTLEWYATPYDVSVHDTQASSPSVTLAPSGTGFAVLYGTNGDDSLRAGAGDSLIVGGHGNDTLNGGIGHDNFQFTDGDGRDLIFFFDPSQDTITLDGYDIGNFAALQALMTQNGGGDTVITFDPNNIITLHAVAMGTLTSSDFVLH